MSTLNHNPQPSNQPHPKSQEMGSKRDRNKPNLILDLFLAAIFVVEMEVSFTGLLLHELLGVLFAVLIVLHIVLHWDWVVSITRTFFRKLIHESRLNYVVNVALFIAVLAATVTGFTVSETLGLDFGLRGAQLVDWQLIHALTSHLSLALTALHVALHWRWIATHIGKYVFPAKQAITTRQPDNEANA
jgi:hypothetical protein